MSTTRTTTNPYETLARRAKADRLADAIETLVRKTGATDDIFVARVAHSWVTSVVRDEKCRATLERKAGVKPASTETWTVVLDVLTAREQIRLELADTTQRPTPARECDTCGDQLPDEPDNFPVAGRDTCATCLLREQRAADGLCGCGAPALGRGVCADCEAPF